MLGNLIKRRDESPAIQDLLVVFSTDGTADIAPIREISEERILAAGEVEYCVPAGDTKVYIGRYGRIFSYPATEENISDTKRLAALERSTVLKQITMFEKERIEPAGKLPIGKLMIVVAIIVIFIIMLAVKK